MRRIVLFFVQVFAVLAATAQSPEPVLSYVLHPDYRLPGQAANHPGPRPAPLNSRQAPVSLATPELVLFGQNPTQRVEGLARDSLPAGAFSVELWMVCHVNQGVGAAAGARGPAGSEDPAWLLGFFGNRMIFRLSDSTAGGGLTLEAPMDRGWKRYWLHLVATYDENTARVFLNGVPKAEARLAGFALPENARLELAAYMAREPFMELANLVKQVNIYDRALTPEVVQSRLRSLKQEVGRGILFPDLFHFTAGPYLHYVTDRSINLSWETDRPVRETIIRYGRTIPLEDSLTLEGEDQGRSALDHCIQTTRLEGLEPGTSYFYELELTDKEGRTIRSGVLTFATAPAGPQPFSFAVLGDTEARPHINARVSRQIWDERPNFLVNLGDLTDGGQREHKFQWPMEYFTGMTPLASRVPVFPVAGNGESDLYWYTRYHQLPGHESYYRFRYGNAEFFMLNSNERDEFAPGGAQYHWLEEQLQASTATWKFVCHHHAPYSSDENDYGDSWKGPSALGDTLVRRIVPLYEQYGVDIVFFWHLHTYQRTLPIEGEAIVEQGGVVYLQAGGAGGNLEDFAPTRSWFSAKTYRGHHYVTVSIDGKRLQLRATDTGGRLRDFFSLNKP